MNIMDLMKNAPGLLDSIQEAGVPADKIGSLGSALEGQLGGSDGFDFTDLLGGLDLDGFLSKIDISSLADQVGISPQVAETVINLIGPKVADFMPSGLGSVGSALGKLFD